jgi:hypothetical protein
MAISSDTRRVRDIGAITRIRAAVADRPWITEIAIFALALLIYQASRALVIGDSDTALDNAANVVAFEKNFGLFFELNVQALLLENIHLTATLNYLYLSAHLPVTAAFFVWLYKRRPGIYPYVRNAFLAANAIALTIFMLYPVAPPRMLPGNGFVDTLQNVSNVDLHGGLLSDWFNPYAAVPSMHMGYALMIGAVGALLVRNWLLRVAFLLYPVAIFVIIVGTANHYVVDALAGMAVVMAGFVLIALSLHLRGKPIILSQPPARPNRRLHAPCDSR